jgi:RNA polymerase sigma-70 factor, ECF subfamily
MHNQEIGAEALLLEKARAGDADAFSELVRLHSSKLYRISLRILKNREDAEDNLQNVFCKAYRSIRDFQGLSKVSTWLARIAVNEALMKLRQNRSVRVIGYSDLTPEGEDEDSLQELEDMAANPERRCTASDLAAKAFEAIEPTLATAFLLTKAEGWTSRELADVLGTTTGNVKSRVFRARCKLRQQLVTLTQSPTIAMNG